MSLKKGKFEKRFPYLALNNGYTQWMSTEINIHNKTELTYHQFIGFFEGRNEENQIYTKEDVEKAYRAGENNQTYYFKDSTVILPNTYEGVDG